MKRHILSSGTKFQAIASLQKIFFILAMLLTVTASGQVDPDTEWKMISTKKSTWIFDAKHQELANYYVALFEQAQPAVLKLFKEASRKPTFVLLDNTDIANGSARVVPTPLVNLLPVLPSPHTSIGEFRNSAYELTAHEYTHILNMEPVHGWISPLKWIFGSIARPNMMLPRWYTEGLAVFTESYLSPGGGRLNSQHLAGVARALTLEDQWKNYPLSQLNDGHPDWLGGSRAYLFGGILWQSLIEEKGLEHIHRNNQKHSRRLPYFLNGVEDYDTQLKKAYGKWSQKAKEQIVTIKEKATLKGRRLYQKGFTSFYPSISPNGKRMAYIVHDHNHRGKIFTVRRHKKKGFRGYKPKEVVSAAQAQSIAWHPKSTGFVYEKTGTYQGYYNFYDLYFYDLKKKKSQSLTSGQRTTYPCFSPSGDFLYFIRNNPGGKEVVQMNWSSKKRQTLYKPPVGTQLMFLGCPKEDTVTFTEQKAGQNSQLLSLNVVSKKGLKHLSLYQPRFAKWTKQGLLFSSSHSGVENLYLTDSLFSKTPSVKAVTNTLTRVHYGDLDPLDSSLYFSQYTAGGAKIFQLKGAQWESLPDTPPKVSPLVSFEQEKVQEPLRKTSSTNSYKAKDFSPWSYMLPNHWIPFIFLVDGGTIFQASTSAGDPLGINSYSLGAQFDTLTKEPGVNFSYVNNSWPVSLGFSVSDIYSFYYPTEQKLHSRSASLNSGFRIFSWSNNLRFNFSWAYSSLSVPTSLGTVELVRQGPSARISYADVSQRGKEVSPESGWTFSLSHRNFLADVGNRSYEQSKLHLGSYWSSIFPKRHSLFLGLNASYAPKLKQNSSFFWTTTLSGPFQNTQLVSDSLMQRGYPSGNFLGWNLININTEYRFPLSYTYRGLTGPPFFIKRFYAHLVFDATTLDGLRADLPSRSFTVSEVGDWFMGYGVEFHVDTTIGFHVPVTFSLGLYQGANQEAGGDFTTFFNLRL